MMEVSLYLQLRNSIDIAKPSRCSDRHAGSVDLPKHKTSCSAKFLVATKLWLPSSWCIVTLPRRSSDIVWLKVMVKPLARPASTDLAPVAVVHTLSLFCASTKLSRNMELI